MFILYLSRCLQAIIVLLNRSFQLNKWLTLLRSMSPSILPCPSWVSLFFWRNELLRKIYWRYYVDILPCVFYPTGKGKRPPAPSSMTAEVRLTLKCFKLCFDPSLGIVVITFSISFVVQCEKCGLYFARCTQATLQSNKARLLSSISNCSRLNILILCCCGSWSTIIFSKFGVLLFIEIISCCFCATSSLSYMMNCLRSLIFVVRPA